MTVVPPVPAPEPTPTPTPAPVPPAPASTPAPAAEPVDPPDLGEAGKRILAEARKSQRDAETARKAAEKLAADTQVELETLRTGQLSEADKAIKAAKAEGANEVKTAMNARLIESEIKVAAAGKLADPADAVKLIDAGQFKVGDDGSIEGDVAKAINDLIAAKPYLAVGATPRPGPVGGGPQGDGITVTRESLKKMTTEQIMQLDPKLVDAAMAAPY